MQIMYKNVFKVLKKILLWNLMSVIFFGKIVKTFVILIISLETINIVKPIRK